MREKTLVSKRDQRGFVMVMVMGFVLLMSMTVVSFTSMIKMDMNLIERAKLGEQAKNLAEAGINHAFVMLKAEGIVSRSNFSGALDTGTYSVTYTKPGTRVLATSVGTVTGTGVSRTVSAEIRGSVPPVLTKMFCGGAGIKARATSAGSSITVVGDIHANVDVELMGLGDGVVNVTGDVAAVNIVREGAQYDSPDANDTNIFINGVNSDAADVSEGARMIAFPVFDYALYKQQAIDAGDYYSGNTTFNGVNLTPSCGVVYVDGNLTIRGNTTLSGGIVANDITIQGTLTQTPHAVGIIPSRNVILSKEGEIGIFDGLFVSEALVYAKTGIRTRSAGSVVDIDGIVLAETGEMSFWNVQTNVLYEYLLTYPSDLDLDFDYSDGEGGEDEGLVLVNWTR